MAITINSLRKVRADQPPRLLIYGPPGIGKTTLAAEFPDAVFLQVEDGTPGDVELSQLRPAHVVPGRDGGLGSIYEQGQGFRTVVLDSVTAMQKLVFAETCRRGDEKGHAKENVEDFGYGKGYVYAQRIWGDLLDALSILRTQRQMTVILIAHSRVQRFDDPETVSYDRYEIDLHDKSKGAIERDMDAILLLKSPVTIQKEEQGFNKDRNRAEGGSQVWINTQPRPAFRGQEPLRPPGEVPLHPRVRLRRTRQIPACSARRPSKRLRRRRRPPSRPDRRILKPENRIWPTSAKTMTSPPWSLGTISFRRAATRRT